MAEQTISQRRAASALASIRSIELQPGKYASHVKAFPAVILMNGLGQAMAMARAKAAEDKAYGHLFGHVATWLKNCPNSPVSRYSDFIDAFTQGSQDDYVWAQGEALAYVEWLKKFAVAFLSDEKDGGKA